MTMLLCEEQYWKHVLEMKRKGTFTTEELEAESRKPRPINQEKYRQSIKSGFRKTGLYPVDPEEPLQELPNLESLNINMDATTEVQKCLIEQLSSYKYNPPANKHPGRPKKADKMAPNVTYTCRPQQVDTILYYGRYW